MAFIERQQKAGKTYFYLTETQRRGKQFRKIRLKLSVDKTPDKQTIARARKQLKKKLSSPQNHAFSALRLDSKRVGERLLIWERPCRLHLVFAAAEAVVKPQIENYGYGWGSTYGFFKENMVKFVWDKKGIIRSGIHIINKLMDSDYETQMMKSWKEKTKALRKRYISMKKLYTLSDTELVKDYESFYRTFLSWWGASQLAECISFGGEYLLKSVVDDKLLSVLTIPSKKSYASVEEESIVRMAMIAKADPDLKKALLDPETPLGMFASYKTFWNHLTKHTKTYFWLNSNYDSIVLLDEPFFLNEIRTVLRNVPDLKHHLESMEQRSQELIEKRNKALESVSLSPAHLAVINLLDTFSIFQDERKAISLEGNHFTYLFLRELSKRTGINLALLYYSTPYEYGKILRGELPVGNLIERRNGSVLVVSTKGICIKTERVYEKTYQKILGRSASKRVLEFEGRRAEGGKVSGTARIVLDPRKPESFHQGDILVTTMTTPDFLPLMKQAAAIITDEGGITCHAAIVARELGLPCVVGTSVATQAVADGDFVEVNANHGIVKIKR